jgi:hypothetical protein
VVEAAALAGFEPQARVVLEGARGLAVPHGDLLLAVREQDREIRLRRRERHLAARLLGGQRRDADLVVRLGLARPSRGVEEREGGGGVQGRLCPRLRDVAVEPAGVVEDDGAREARQRGAEDGLRLVQEAASPSDRLVGLGHGRVALHGPAHGILERQLDRDRRIGHERCRRGSGLRRRQGRRRDRILPEGGSREREREGERSATHGRLRPRERPVGRPRGAWPCRERSRG